MKKEKSENRRLPTYIKDLVAGRPVFGHPSRSGASDSDMAEAEFPVLVATSMHPATMAITDSFIAIGTQLKIENQPKDALLHPVIC